MDLTGIVDHITPDIHSLQKLINLVVAKFLAQTGQHIAELSNAYVACPVFVEYLEAAHKLVGLAGGTEAAGAVEDLLEGVEVNCEASVSESVT